MNEGVERLCTVLEAEERLYVSMRDLLQGERELMASLDAAGLERSVRRKETLAEEGRFLEASRVEVVADLAEKLGFTQARPTLSQICEALGEDAGRLREAHSRLAALVGAVQELLEANAAFAGEAQAQVQATLQLLGRLLPESSSYEPGGAEPTPAGGRLVRQSA